MSAKKTNVIDFGCELYEADPNTGEATPLVSILVPAGSIVVSPAQQQARRDWVERSQAEEQRQAIIKAQNNEMRKMGSYFKARFKRDQPLNDFDNAFLARLAFLASHMDYDSSLWCTQRTKMTKEAARRLLGLSKSVFYDFWKRAVDQSLVCEKEDTLAISTPMFWRGKSGPTGYTNGWMRIYCDTYRKLYCGVKPSQHIYLGAILRMMPYINIEFNVLCRNQFATNIEEIDPITLTEMCVLLGMTEDNAKHWRRKYEGIVLSTEEGPEKFCATIKSDAGIELVFVNPRVLYAGSNPDQVEILKLYFSDPVKSK